jgi:hypothetical protein
LKPGLLGQPVPQGLQAFGSDRKLLGLEALGATLSDHTTVFGDVYADPSHSLHGVFSA